MFDLKLLNSILHVNNNSFTDPFNYRGFRETSPWVWVSLWPLAGFVHGRSKFKSLATLVNSQLVASCQLRFLILYALLGLFVSKYLSGVPANKVDKLSALSTVNKPLPFNFFYKLFEKPLRVTKSGQYLILFKGAVCVMAAVQTAWFIIFDYLPLPPRRYPG